MNKLKKVFLFIVILILFWTFLITIDSVRFSRKRINVKPIITLNSKQKDNKIIYKGLGYSINYYITEIEINNQKQEKCYGAEFRLFNDILIWAWIE